MKKTAALLIFMMFSGMAGLVMGLYVDQPGTAAGGGILFGLGLGFAFGYGSALTDVWLAGMCRRFKDEGGAE